MFSNIGAEHGRRLVIYVVPLIWRHDMTRTNQHLLTYSLDIPPSKSGNSPNANWLVSDMFHPTGERSHSNFPYVGFVGKMAQPENIHSLPPGSAAWALGRPWATMPVPWCNERRCTLIPDVAERGLRVRQLWDLCIFLTSWLHLAQFSLMWVYFVVFIAIDLCSSVFFLVGLCW